jgi:hypothetical protein
MSVGKESKVLLNLREIMFNKRETPFDKEFESEPTIHAFKRRWVH